MITHWQIVPSLKPQILILAKYQWDEEGFTLRLEDTVDNQTIRINFSVNLDGVRVIYRHDAVETELQVYQLMKGANLSDSERFVPAFIQDSSDLIDYVRAKNLYSNLDDAKLLHYIIITDDFWIDVVSSELPHIITEDRGT